MNENPLLAEIAQDEVAGLRELARKQQERIERLEKLRPYAGHSYACPVRWLPGGECTCGLDEILALLRGQEAEPGYPGISRDIRDTKLG